MPESTPIACNLGKSERADRAKLMSELGRSLIAVEAAGLRAELRFESDRAPIEEFIRAESGCCPFFTFELKDDNEAMRLGIGAPEGGEAAVRGVVAEFVAGWRWLM